MIEIGNNLIDISDLEMSDDINVINKSLATHPGKFGEISRISVVIKCKKEELELQLKRLKAEVDSKIRSNLSKKTTETNIDNLISLEPAVKELEDKLLNIRKDELMINTLKEAYQHRKDCLLDLARNLRAQLYNLGPQSI